MANWLTIDKTGLTLHIPPVPDTAATLLWATGLMISAFLAASAWTNREKSLRRIGQAWTSLTGFLQKHYLKWIILFGIIAVVWAVWNYLWQVPGLIGEMLDDLRAILGEEDVDTEDVRNIGYTFAALAGMLAILATIPFQLVRVWINERTARTQEANLTTGLLNTAVEGLGAEKTVTRVGRPVRFKSDDGPDRTEIEWQGKPFDPPPCAFSDWQAFDTTTPNLEVRIGAILTLERIAKENPEEHIRVMDILCAYIRENAPASEAEDHGLGDWPVYPENPTEDELMQRDSLLRWRRIALRLWVRSLPPPRTDIQLALEVIGHRDPERIRREEAIVKRKGETGYRLDLRNTNLRGCELSKLEFSRADFSNALLQGAKLRETWLCDARMQKARLEVSSLQGAKLRKADLEEARLEWSNLYNAKMQDVNLDLAHLGRASLTGARLEGARLKATVLEGASLIKARLDGATLWMARLSGADLRYAQLLSVDWEKSQGCALVHSADLRGARNLKQSQLDQMVGNEETLLPDDECKLSIPSSWRVPPPFFNALSWKDGRVQSRTMTSSELRAEYVCPPGEEPERTGTRLPLNAPYPKGHPLNDAD